MMKKSEEFRHNEVEMATSETYKALSTYQKLWDYLINQLEKKIKAEELNKSHLADELGVANSTVTRWFSKERGVKNARLLDAIRIANYLKLEEKDIRNQLTRNELRAFALVSQLKNGKGMLMLHRSVQYIDAKGKYKIADSLDNTLSFSPQFLKNLAQESEQNFLFTVESSTMCPTINPGDTVMIAPADNTIRNQKIYAVKIDGRMIISRLNFDGGSLVLSFDSPEVESQPLDLSAKNVELIGRVVWLSKEL